MRAIRAVGLDEPLFVRCGEGAWIEDEQGRRYVDWVMSWGPLLFGHADSDTVEAVVAAAREGTTFGAATEREVELAEELVDAVPSLEMVRLVSSGTEAAMSAVRLARAATRRDRILKFAGGYHGHADALLAESGSGLATLGIPATPGVTSGAAQDTIVVPYNDVDATAAAVERWGEGLAAIVVEPVAGNMGVVPPEPGFLEALRDLCDASGALLVFDEVITGFRVARGGAQERFGVVPDLTLLGKIAGGGLPLASFGGRGDVMEQLAPSGQVYQAGTLSGNPLATAAALSVLRRLREWYQGPIIILSARDQEEQKIMALDHGADDYLTKPFSTRELLARMRVALRHASRPSGEGDASAFMSGDLKVELAARRVFVKDQEVHLTPLEYKLLTTLIRHAGKVLTHRFLLKEVWGPHHVLETPYLRVFMASLRRKIEADPSQPKYLLTEPGVGYRLAAE